ncbi:MAG: hypothetical protein L0Y72_19295 [Gemmataceae bacterium]|nr:hypothetical protein [Gemmataceae bacterium]MCI0741181.1 hypothetical protein [Gemmataceae bacterium]
MNERKTRRTERDDSDIDESPIRKKKKKKKKEAAKPWPKIIALGGGGAVAFILLIILLINFMGGSPPAQPVTTWEKFSTEENEFGFEYPAGWNTKHYGITGRREVDVIGKNGASISLKENLVGSLIGDIAGSQTGGRPVPDELSPVGRAHDMRQPKDTTSYKEHPAETVMTRFGKARRSFYVDGAKRGYRVTILMHKTALDVFCECRESDWGTLRPAFDHVIETIGRGG